MTRKINPNLANPRISQLYDFIKSYIERERFSPCIREMGEAIKSPSTSITNYYLDRLIALGKLEKIPNIARGVRLPDGANDKETITVYRCPKYPNCDIHSITAGHCIQHEIRLREVMYKEV